MQHAADRGGEDWLCEVSQRVASRRIVRRAQREAASARRDARDAMQAKAAFLAGLNHELRTPLNAITGFAGLLRENADVTPDKREEYLEHILHSAGLLLGRIDAILEAAGKVGPRGHDDVRRTDPLPILRRLLQEHAGTLFVGKVEIAEELPQTALSSRDLYTVLQQTFQTLSSDDGQRQAIGLEVAPGGPGGKEVSIVFELLTNPDRIDQSGVRGLRAEIIRRGVRLDLERDHRDRTLVRLRLPASLQETAA